MSDWDEDTVRERTRQAISEADMTKTSMRDLRKTVEKEMGLQKNALKPNKAEFKTMVQEMLQEMNPDDASEDSEDQVVADVESKFSSGNEDENDAQNTNTKKSKKTKKRKRKPKSAKRPKPKKPKRTKKSKKKKAKEIENEVEKDDDTQTDAAATAQVFTEDPQMDPEDAEPLPMQLTFTSSEEDNNDDPVEDNNANDETFKPESESDGDDEEALMDLEKVLEESSYEDVSSDEEDKKKKRKKNKKNKKKNPGRKTGSQTGTSRSHLVLAPKWFLDDSAGIASVQRMGVSMASDRFGQAHVVVNEKKLPYSTTLQRTVKKTIKVKPGKNAEKGAKSTTKEEVVTEFFQMQLLKQDSGNMYWLFTRQGRDTRKRCRCKMTSFLGTTAALAKFRSTYHGKTGVEFGDEIDPENSRGWEAVASYDPVGTLVEKSEIAAMSLAPKITSLIQTFIQDTSKTVAAIGLDGDSGLASLEGFLPKIANKCLRILKRCKTAVAKDKAASMTELIAELKRILPTQSESDSDLVISTNDDIAAKEDEVLKLERIHFTLGLQQKPVPEIYRDFKCNINHVKAGTKPFSEVSSLLERGQCEDVLSGKLALKDMYSIDRVGETESISAFDALGKRVLLWHPVSSLSLPLILSQGLRVPRVESTGLRHPHGKGIYFTDVASQAALDVGISDTEPLGYMLLVEVVTGKQHMCTSYDSNNRAPGCHSVMVSGQYTAAHDQWRALEGDGKVPPVLGSFGQVERNPKADANTVSACNQYIVHDYAQVRMRYLLRVELQE